MDAEHVTQVKRRSSRLSELKDHPSWPELQAALDDRKEKTLTGITRQLMAGEPVDQRYLDRVAGFYVGAQWILDNPDLNERRLTAVLAKAELLGLLEGEVIA